MSVASKKRRRWARLIARTTKERDQTLQWRIEDIRRHARYWANEMSPDELERRTQEKINELIVDTPESLIFREKRRARRAKPGWRPAEIARSVARVVRSPSASPVHVSFLTVEL